MGKGRIGKDPPLVYFYDLFALAAACYLAGCYVSARYFLSIAVMLRPGHVLAQVAAARFTRIAPCWRLGYDFAHRKFA